VMFSQCQASGDVDTAVRIFTASRNFYKLQRRHKRHRHQHALLVPEKERMYLHKDNSLSSHSFWHPMDYTTFWLEVLMVLLSTQIGQAVASSSIKQWELMSPRELFTTVKKVHHIVHTQVTAVGTMMRDVDIAHDVTRNTVLALAKRFELSEDSEVALLQAVHALYSA